MTKKQAAAAPAILDLSELDAAVARQEDGLDVDILGLDGKTPLGLRIRVAGPDSQRAQSAQEAQADELIAQGELGRPSAAESRKRGTRYLARITIGWEPVVKIGGEDLAYSTENAERLYSRFPFIRDQVNRAAGDRARFLAG